jgi:dTMP kinase
MVNKAPFITFEGGEGSGKSTQIKLLKEWLAGRNIAVTAAREPGGTEGAEAIRNLLVQGKENRWDTETDTLLFSAARRDLLAKIIWPALERGEWVLCDRFLDSTYAYQCYGRGLPLEKAKAVYKFLAGDFMPDVTFFLDIDPRKGIERALHGKNRATHENRYEGFDFSFHENLHAAYKKMASEDPKRFITINADQSLDAVQDDLRTAITKRFGL